MVSGSLALLALWSYRVAGLRGDKVLLNREKFHPDLHLSVRLPLAGLQALLTGLQTDPAGPQTPLAGPQIPVAGPQTSPA